MTVKIGVLIRQEGIVVGLRVKIRVSCVIKRDPTFLFLSLSDILDWVSAPNLSFLHNSPRRNNAVRGNNSSLLQDRALQDNRVMTDVNTFFDCAGVKGAIVLNDVISLDEQFRAKSSGRVGSSMKDAIVANANIADKSESRQEIRNSVDIPTNDSPMPNGDIVAEKDIADYGSVGCNKNEALIIDIEVVEIHDVAGSTEGFCVLPRCLDALC